ncbi:hypothetical protein JCM11251_001856 [Rhodosporidiobolus azoricus]
MPAELPLELWQLIIRSALPTKLSRHGLWASNTWNEHTEILRTCCLVSSTWRAIAQPLLCEQAFVSEVTIDDLLDTLVAAPHLRQVVRVLKVFRKADYLSLAALLESLPSLEELYFTQVGEFDLSFLKLAPNLRKLSGWGNELSFYHQDDFSLPNLVEISFCGTTFLPSTSDFFHPSFLPNLRAAAVCYPRITEGDGTDVAASHLLDSFPPSLFVLTTWNPRIGLPVAGTAPHTVYTLREEALDWSESSLGTPHRCGSSSIQHLHLHEVPNALATGVSPHLEDDAALKNLDTLYLALGHGSDPAGPNYEAYREFGRRKGVELVFTTEQEFMEESLLDPVLLRRHVRVEEAE